MADKKAVRRVREQLARWREDIINLARTNRLLYFRHLRTGTLEITAPDPVTLLQGLDAKGWSIFMPPDPEEGELLAPPAIRAPDELETNKETARELQNSLTQLARRTEQEFMDKGLWVLYLGVGFLRWIDEDDQPAESPILLVPVQLHRDSPREPYRVVRADEDATLNPALAVKLAEFGVTLPTLDEVEEKGVPALFSRVKAAIKNWPQWKVESRAVLGVFSFQKEVMYRDLLDNEDAIVEHPLVVSLAVGASSGDAAGAHDFDPLPEERLDEEAPPEELATVLDADASQRQCIVAARDGHSFVMDGPPGTGKSQTIANIVAELLLGGKTVLFVSEKAAALEVVEKRLTERGLDDFALELHSHKATRREVAQALAEPLHRRRTAGPQQSSTSRARLKERRQALSAHAAAMNERRQPLGRTLHEAIGRVAQLSDAPVVPFASLDESLSAKELGDILDHADRLAAAWGPVERGEDFLWREPSSLAEDPAHRAELPELLHACARALVTLKEATRDTADELDLPWWQTLEDARRLTELLEHLEKRPVGPTSWLTTKDLRPVRRRMTALSELSVQRERAVTDLRQFVGDGWDALPGDGQDRSVQALASLDGSWLTGRPKATDTATRVAARIVEVEQLSPICGHAGDLFPALTEACGAPGADPTLNETRRLAEIVVLLDPDPAPRAEWLVRGGAATATKAVTVLRPLVESWTASRATLTDVFTDEVLGLDLDGLVVRFETVHTGLRKLRGAYREDKRTLAAVTRAQRVDDSVVGKLSEARDWKRLTAELEEAEGRHAEILGDSYRREKTDFEGLEALIRTARQVVDLTDGGFPKATARRLADGSAVAPGVVEKAKGYLASLDGSSDDGSLLGQVLARKESPTWEEVREACDEALEPLRDLEDLLREVGSTARRELSINELGVIASRREDLAGIDEEFSQEFDRDRGLIGDSYQREDTDWNAVREQLAWADRLRELMGGPLDDRRLRALFEAPPRSDGLRGLLAAWEAENAAVLEYFTPERQASLRPDLEGPFEDSSQLLDALEASVSDLDEWHAFVEARKRLKEAGLAKSVTKLVSSRASSDQVAPSLERACLQAWIEAVAKNDTRRVQSNMLAADRDRLLEEFRRLDRELVERKANEIIEACNARRPRALSGAGAVIVKEAEKKRRHMPVRRLLAETGGLAQTLKPCFLMSPLTVSQFLPSDMRFDAVVFDEASQVRPADAINCVYRGDQLIVAGDQRQLPPTSFFERFTQDDGDEWVEDQLEEFDSVLDLAKGSGALQALSLRWHYRSQHESLITYSNYSFYDGRLVTFPGAAETADDVGVELFPVHGVYRRGGARDNPVEAAVVVERVLSHARNHPTLTLGVVAFSEAQASTIEAELNRQRVNLPELDNYFDADRLDGFFIKNLENVQGDERDIIVFSIGYGPDENGKFTLNFGPLNNTGGQRRLNVAVTRARRRVEVVSSFTAADIKHEAGTEGVRHLRRYLDFAERGIAALAIDVSETQRDVESPFEDEVARVVRFWGYDVVPQVGSAGYRIDLAVRHPEQHGRFMLGIECDGAMYHSSRVARDRDRLRQEVLEGLGWRIHRIWGTSWYRDRGGQEERLRQALTEAQARQAAKPRHRDRSVPPPRVETIDHEAAPSWTTPYKVATLSGPQYGYEMHEREAQDDLKRLLLQVVKVESPVAQDVALRRIRESWGVQRSGSRIREAFAQAREALRRRGSITLDAKGFLWDPADDQVVVRVPDGDLAAVRDVDEVPPEEIERAILGVVSDALRISHDEISVRVARCFGWARRGAGITNVIDAGIRALIDQGRLVAVDGSWLAPAQREAGTT